MKISVISNTSHTCPPIGWGGEIVIWDLCEGLSELGHEITLYAPMGSQCPTNGKLIEIPLCESSNPQLEFELYNKYKYELNKSDIVHDFSHNKIFINLLYQNGYKNSVCTYFGFSWYQKARNILVPSESSRFAATNGLNGFERTPWYNQVGHTGKNESVKSLHLGTNSKFYLPKYEKSDYLLYFGGLMEYKGINIGIELAKQMGFKFIIACGEPDAKIYKELRGKYLESIEGYENIKYIEIPNDEHHHYIKRNLIQNAKAFLFPVLYREGFGLVTIESLSCATPVITFNHGSMPEIIKHNETGFLCNNIEEMMSAIKNIDKIDNKKCREDIIERFDRIPMAKRHIKIYEDVINGLEW